MAFFPLTAEFQSDSKPVLMRGPQAATSPNLGAPAKPVAWQAVLALVVSLGITATQLLRNREGNDCPAEYHTLRSVIALVALWLPVGNISRLWRPSTLAQLAVAEVAFRPSEIDIVGIAAFSIVSHSIATFAVLYRYCIVDVVYYPIVPGTLHTRRVVTCAHGAYLHACSVQYIVRYSTLAT